MATKSEPVTVTVIEPTTATVESGTFIVEATTLTSLEGLVASGASTKNVAQEALDAINSVKGTLATGGDVGYEPPRSTKHRPIDSVFSGQHRWRPAAPMPLSAPG